MADLTREYTDIKEIKHSVEHLILPASEKNNREQIIKELAHALTRPRKEVY